jgi:hypothetical protein
MGKDYLQGVQPLHPQPKEGETITATYAPTVDLEELRRLAEAATPGEWVAISNSVKCGRFNVCPTVTAAGTGVSMDEKIIAERRNAKFIAAANPQTVLALLDRIRELESLAKDLRQVAYWVIEDEKGGTEAEINEYIDDGLMDCANMRSES